MLRPRRRRETNKSLIKETKVPNFKADTVTDVTAVVVVVVIVRSVARTEIHRDDNYLRNFAAN